MVVGEPARRDAGLAIMAALGLAVVFAVVTVVSKETPALDLHQPWQDDPYDVLVSLDFVAVPLLVVIGVMRVLLCRRYEPLPARRLVDLLRVAEAALVVSLATEVAEWVAVALGRHRATWTAATTWQVAALVVLTATLFGGFVLVRRAARAVSRIATAAEQPDWFTDAIALGLRATWVLGRHRGPALTVIRWVDSQLVARIRAHSIAAAGLLAAVLALPFVAAKILLEGYPAQLVLLVFAFVTASLFVFVVVVGAYLRVLAPRRASAPAWLCTAVVACTAGTVAFAFHDSILAHQTVNELSALFLGVVAAAGAVSLAVQALWRLHTHAN